MAPIHVAFIEMAVTMLHITAKDRPRVTIEVLINAWNEQHAAKWTSSSKTFATAQISSGRADIFFPNRYVSIEELERMAREELPRRLSLWDRSESEGHRT